MRVPLQSDLFQEDIFPDFCSDEPALTATEWMEGKNALPKRSSWREGTTITFYMIRFSMDFLELFCELFLSIEILTVSLLYLIGLYVSFQSMNEEANCITWVKLSDQHMFQIFSCLFSPVFDAKKAGKSNGTTKVRVTKMPIKVNAASANSTGGDSLVSYFSFSHFVIKIRLNCKWLIDM